MIFGGGPVDSNEGGPQKRKSQTIIVQLMSDVSHMSHPIGRNTGSDIMMNR